MFVIFLLLCYKTTYECWFLRLEFVMDSCVTLNVTSLLQFTIQGFIPSICVNISLSCKGYISLSYYVVVIFLSRFYKTTYECSFYTVVIRYVKLCHIECYITVTINCTKMFCYNTISNCIQIYLKLYLIL